MATNSERPVGEAVPDFTCHPPVHEPIKGRYAELIPTKADHADELWEAVGGEDKDWLFDYMFYGPFANEEALRELLAVHEKSKDPLYWTIRLVATGKLVGFMAFARIDTTHRVIEIGHIVFGPPLQRTTAATEAWYLLASKAVRLLVDFSPLTMTDNATVRRRLSQTRMERRCAQ